MVRERIAPVVAVIVIAAVAAVAVAVAAPVSAGRDAPEKVTRAGVGAVKLGATYRHLRRRNLVGPLRPGCPLAGPGSRSARLKSPLRGTVDFTRRRPHRVRTIAIGGGAAARGVRIGDPLAKIRRSYARVRVDRSTERTFGLWVVSIPRRAGGRIGFTVDAQTRKVTLIGVPHVPFCE